MHRGVRELIRWVQRHGEAAGAALNPPATANALNALEQDLGTPIPADLRIVLSVFDGGTLPHGTLLGSAESGRDTIRAALAEVASAREVEVDDPELLLPFHRTDQGTYLAFERAAAPLPDTWPIVDYDLESGDVRIVHRTFDGWCRLAVADWTAPDYAEPFTVDKYLRQGKRHADIEPDVSIAHVTVAHASRRAGEPERALESYLRAGRCVPSVPWADWEALKLAVVLRYPADALEAGSRLGGRAPEATWEARDSQPSIVAYALALIAPPPGEAQAPWLRIVDQLASQALDEDDRRATRAIRAAMSEGKPPPLPFAAPEPVVAPDEDLDAFWAAACEAYAQGTLREETLLLDPSLRPLGERFDLADILRIRRDF